MLIRPYSSADFLRHQIEIPKPGLVHSPELAASEHAPSQRNSGGLCVVVTVVAGADIARA